MEFTKSFKYLSLGVLLSYAHVGYSQTLEQAINEAIKTNPDIKVQEASRYASDHRLGQAYSGYLPLIDTTLEIGRDKRTNSNTRSETGGSRTLTKRTANITLNQMLFDGFNVTNSVSAGQFRVHSAANNVVSVLEDVALRTVEAYLDTLRRIEIVAAAKENLENHQRVFEQIQLRTETGLSRKADLDQANARLAFARTNLMTEQANLRDAEANYIRVVGVRPRNLSIPRQPVSELPNTEDTAIAVAIDNHPAIKAANAELKAAGYEKGVSKSSYYPRLDFVVDGSKGKNVDGADTDTDNLTASLKFSYNLFRGGADRAREKEVAWQYEETKESRNRVVRQVEQSTRLSWNAFTSARAQLIYFKQHWDSTLKTRESYRSQFKIGQRTLLDLLDSENEAFTSQASYIAARYTELLGRYRILNSMGMLSSFLNLDMPESTNVSPKSWADVFGV